MTPEGLAAIERFARRAHRKWPGISADEFRQEAAVVSLERRRTLGYFDMLEVVRRVTRATLPVEIPATAVPEGVSFTELWRCKRTIPEVPLSWSADTAINLQLAARIERLKAAIAEAEHRATRGLPSWVRECGRTAAAGRSHGMQVDLARKFEVSALAVFRALGRYSRWRAPTGGSSSCGACWRCWKRRRGRDWDRRGRMGADAS